MMMVDKSPLDRYRAEEAEAKALRQQLDDLRRSLEDAERRRNQSRQDLKDEADFRRFQAEREARRLPGGMNDHERGER